MTFPNLHSGVQYHQLPFTSASQPPKYGIVCRTTQRAVVQRIVVTNFNYTLLRSSGKYISMPNLKAIDKIGIEI